MKKRRMIPCMALLFAILLLVRQLPMAYANNDASDDVQEEISELQKKIDQNKKEQEQKAAEIEQAKAKTKDTKAQLNTLYERDALLQNEINLLDDQIGLMEQQIAENEAEEQAQTALFHRQVRLEEETGSVSYWSVLFKATGFTDLLDRIDFINEMVEYHNSVIENLQALRADLNDQKDALEGQAEQKDAAQTQLNAQMAETSNLYQNYLQTQEGLQAEYDMIKAEADALDGLMEEAEARARELGIQGYAATLGGYIWPCSVKGITSHFGGRKSPGGIGSTNHKGVDIATPMYTKVYAAKSGTVTRAANKYDGYGNCVIIYHGDGNYTLYGHLAKFAVNEGDYVSQGQLIAYSGNTGNSTGPHLHFGVMENDIWVDPLGYLSGWYWCGN